MQMPPHTSSPNHSAGKELKELAERAHRQPVRRPQPSAALRVTHLHHFRDEHAEFDVASSRRASFLAQHSRVAVYALASASPATADRVLCEDDAELRCDCWSFAI